ncbi:MAG: hypothetical protein JRJ29_07365 [Deltaproteobacteria bacterium]|nr:hypothetical protein [Deltaproteobacteria bacterium]
MTHTLHRRGDKEGLREDYVMLILYSKGINEEGAQEKFKKIWDIIKKHGSEVVNFGNVTAGNSHTATFEDLQNSENKLVHAVFKDRDKLKACLRDIKEGNFGLSVVLSGIYEDVKRVWSEIGLKPHTVEHSLGIHGKTDLLPDENILEISTMCGHSLVFPHLVCHMVEQIKGGHLTFEEAADRLSRGCACGIFNPYRAGKILRKIVENG